MIYCLQGEIDIDALQFYTDLVENHHLMNEWNPSLQHARTLAAINENTELSYNISTPSAGGLISSRYVCPHQNVLSVTFQKTIHLF